MKRNLLFLLALLLLVGHSSQAQNQRRPSPMDKIKLSELSIRYDYGDSIVYKGYMDFYNDEFLEENEVWISVLSPTQKQVFTLYGHAILGVYDKVLGDMEDYDFGSFDPATEDFIYKFVRGEVDYSMGVESGFEELYSDWIAYGAKGSDHLLFYYPDRDITKFRLNLPKEAIASIKTYLEWNREDSRYRYNFFYDNCSTRLLDIIEWALRQGDKPQEIRYDEEAIERELGKRTWRSVINELESPSPWLVLGTDLALGMPTDRVMSWRDRAFIPRDLATLLRHASVTITDKETGQEKVVPLVAEEAEHPRVEEPPMMPTLSWWERPLGVFSLSLLPLWVLALVRFVRRRAYALWVDALYLGVVGLLGCVLLYISYGTVHPFVSPNLNLWVLSPVHLVVGVPLLAFGGRSVWAYRYHFINFVVQMAFLLSSYFLPQSFHPVIYLLSASLGLMSLSLIYRGRAGYAEHTT